MINEIQKIQDVWNRKSDHSDGIEWIVKMFLLLFQFLFPGIYIRTFFSKYTCRKTAIDIYVLLKVIFSFLIIYLNLYNDLHIFSINIIIVLIIYFAIETVIYIATLVFCKILFSKDVSYTRATLLGFLNFFELVFTFASLYAFTNSLISSNCINKTLDTVDYIYFSFITVTTIGYGDFIVQNQIGKILVIFQSVIFFIFCFVFLSYNISKINSGVK